MYKRIIILLTLLLTPVIGVFSQHLPLHNVPSPEVAGLGDYGTIPVEFYAHAYRLKGMTNQQFSDATKNIISQDGSDIYYVLPTQCKTLATLTNNRDLSPFTETIYEASPMTPMEI